MLLPEYMVINRSITKEAKELDNEIMEQIKEIQALIQDVPDGERLYLPKDKIENLLFIDIVYHSLAISDTGKQKVRFLYHRFVDLVDLSKIDLSEVDFSGVCWLKPLDMPFCGVITDKRHLRQLCDRGVIFGGRCYDSNWNLYVTAQYQMDLSNTNAKIDFQDSFFPEFETEMRSIYADHVLEGYNFEGTDLSDSNIGSSFLEIKNCNLNNTGELNFEDKSLGERTVRDCSFIGTTVNGYTITNENENAEAIESINYFGEHKFRK